MKEFVKKLIGRLEEEKKRLRRLPNDCISLCDREVIDIEEKAYNFCKEIVNQLAEEYEECFNLCSENCEVYDKEKHYCPKWCKVIRETVEELKEEYFKNAMIDGQYCWQTCGATEHCKECNRLGNGSIDYYENYDVLAEEHKDDIQTIDVSELLGEQVNDGWISVEDRLPEETECYFVTWRDRATCKNYVEITEYDAGSQEWLDCICQAGLLGYDIIAWQPLPAPYQPKGE